MSAQPPSPVVVGIDGSRDGLLALEWAVRFAGQRQLPLRAVYVVDDARTLPPAVATAPDDGSEAAEEAADELFRLGFTAGSVEVRHGDPAMRLVELAAHASALVIGRRGMGGFAELVLGSTSQVCAALAPGTLIVVPDSWQPDAAAQGRVLVGVDGSADCQAALGFAFETAARQNSELLAVHAAHLPETFPPPDVWLDPDDQPWTARAEAVVAGSLAGWREKYPEVVVRTRCTSGHPVQLLARESALADLVVVGGRGQTQFSPLRMGSVSRGLLHHSQCPVAVIHPEECTA